MNRILSIFGLHRETRAERARLRHDSFILCRAFAPELIDGSGQEAVFSSIKACSKSLEKSPTLHWELTEVEHGRRGLRANWNLAKGVAPGLVGTD